MFINNLLMLKLILKWISFVILLMELSKCKCKNSEHTLVFAQVEKLLIRLLPVFYWLLILSYSACDVCACVLYLISWNVVITGNLLSACLLNLFIIRTWIYLSFVFWHFLERQSKHVWKKVLSVPIRVTPIN